jgi:phasin
METPMTDTTTNVLDSVKQAFAPVTDALKNIDVPEATRDFVKRAATTARDRAADLHAGSEKVTSALETAVSGSVSEAAKISRSVQEAFYQDTAAFFAGIERLAGASSLTEAVQIQSDLIRARGEVLMGRAKSASDYVTKLVADGARTAQDNFSKAAEYGKTA